MGKNRNFKSIVILPGIFVMLGVSAILADSGQIDGDTLSTWTQDSPIGIGRALSDSVPPGYKSPSGALSRSLVGTLAPIPTIILAPLGLIVGPSLGYFYGGLPSRGLTGIGVRLVGVGAMVGALASCNECNDSQTGTAIMVMAAGAGLTLTSIIVDLGDVKKAVAKRNSQLTFAAELRLAPSYSSERRTAGIRLAYCF